MLKSGKQFNLSMALKQDLQKSRMMINMILSHLNLVQHEALVKLRRRVHEKYPGMRALDSIDGLLMEGRVVMYNRQTRYHADIGELVIKVLN